MTSPKEEADSARELARSGVVPLTSAMGAQGVDPEENCEEIAFGNKLLDHFGLILDSDPRKVGRVSAGSAPTPGENPQAPPPDAPIKKTAAEGGDALAAPAPNHVEVHNHPPAIHITNVIPKKGKEVRRVTKLDDNGRLAEMECSEVDET